MAVLVMALILANYIIRPGDWVPGLDVRWNLILNIVGSLVLIAMVVTGGAGRSWDRTWLYLMGFFLLMMVSSVVMQQMSTIPFYAPQMLTNILVYTLICSAVQSTKQLRLVTNIFSALAIFVVYQCHLQITVGENIAGIAPLIRNNEATDLEGFITRSQSLQALWVGVFEDPNDVGLLFVALLPFALVRAIYIPNGLTSRVLSAVTAAALIYGVYLTDSRGTFVALLGGVGFFFILKFRSVRGLIVAGFGGFLLITVGPSRMASITAADDSAMERIYAWIEALYAFSLYPVFGLGPKHWADWHHKTTHNSFVLAFVENGFAAYVCWLAVIAIPLYLVTRAAFTVDDEKTRIEYAAWGACLAGVMLSIFFISRTYVLVPYFVTACVLTFCRVQDRTLYARYIADATPIRLGAVAAGSIVMIWITNILTTRLML